MDDNRPDPGGKHPDSPGRMWKPGVASQGGFRLILVFVIAAALGTAIGVVTLWPTGEGIASATVDASDIGLVTDRFSATVTEIRDGPCSYALEDNPVRCRLITVVPDEGPDQGSPVALAEFDLTYSVSVPPVSLDQKIILGYEPSTDFYFYADTDRRTPLVWLSLLFALFVVALGRFRGVLALVGMGGTLVVLVGFLAPSVLDGNDPLLVAVVAASAIAYLSMYLAHGFNRITTVALAGTISSLGLTLAFSWTFFELANFTGLATEEALVLPFIAGGLDISSLILGGAVIGALGALDDMTVTQAALVSELHHLNPALPVRRLILSGIRVGREHIASTVNTLLLAYVGASIPLLLLTAVSNQSLVMVANSELVAVEIVRTLCGSMGLVTAVPVTTFLAALVMAGPSDSTQIKGDPPPESDPTNPIRNGKESGSD
ncbi:MAG: YibE/F family protein [Acidimicrobiia bacterium]|nr:YibE/F family protein [Acidimicrobiia bacterium]